MRVILRRNAVRQQGRRCLNRLGRLAVPTQSNPASIAAPAGPVKPQILLWPDIRFILVPRSRAVYHPRTMPIDPSTLRIISYPDPRLRRPAKPVANADHYVADVARKMLELMKQAPGVGLAAPQVGLPWRLFVANATGEPGDDRVFINPELREPTPETESAEEGCLSIPQVRAEITRPVGITIEATDLDGNRFTLTDRDLPARIWQHETDHLDGVLIIDRMTPTDRRANLKQLRELEEQGSGIGEQGSGKSRL